MRLRRLMAVFITYVSHALFCNLHLREWFLTRSLRMESGSVNMSREDNINWMHQAIMRTSYYIKLLIKNNLIGENSKRTADDVFINWLLSLTFNCVLNRLMQSACKLVCKSVFHAGDLRKIGTGLQIDSLNWPPDHSTGYLNLVHNIVHWSVRIHLFYLFAFSSLLAFLLFP